MDRKFFCADVKVLLSIILMVTFFSSCDVVKRKYRNGFYVSNAKTTHSTKQFPEKNPVTKERENPAVALTNNKQQQQQQQQQCFTEQVKQVERTIPAPDVAKKTIADFATKKIKGDEKKYATSKETTKGHTKISRHLKKIKTLGSVPHGCNPTPGESFLIGVLIVIGAAFCLAVPPVPICFGMDDTKHKGLLIFGICAGWVAGIILLLLNVAVFWPLFFAILVFNALFLGVFYLLENL